MLVRRAVRLHPAKLATFRRRRRASTTAIFVSWCTLVKMAKKGHAVIYFHQAAVNPPFSAVHIYPLEDVQTTSTRLYPRRLFALPEWATRSFRVLSFTSTTFSVWRFCGTRSFVAGSRTTKAWDTVGRRSSSSARSPK
ncbi:hypothetical protein RvY_02052-2 [Ramazzottius varieornatus]|uniref:Uncharacterized protein n=1 Tax=Ramazzottius varieornatus TaxID=947166 RepID=A0A1D1UTK1_RAMVA|nr:hypothetical protein RvY_02052-2 [Ramazzottius varieornatus]